MNSRVAVLVTPRSGPPYQELLYRSVEAAGVRVRYAEGPTPSQTVNITLMPAVLIWRRLRGDQILHIHWVFQFYLPWARHKRWARRLMERWFDLYLRTAQQLGYAIVWTAHDLVPHEQVFEDDGRARGVLLSRARVVIALSEATATELHELAAHDVRVIPMGSYAEPYPVTLTRAQARSSFDFATDDVVVSLIGMMEEYKGTDLLLEAAAQLPASSRIKILLAGSCKEQSYRDKLTRLAERLPGRVVTHLQWVPDEDLARFLQATDVAAFPFREITNSGSINLAQSFGLPVMIPNLAALRDIPDSTTIRFEPGINSLVAALLRAEQLSESEYVDMSAAALAWSARSDWRSIAGETIQAYEAAWSAKSNERE
jgi:glycosyltransferase involved in cell wall biosynthesis